MDNPIWGQRRDEIRDDLALFLSSARLSRPRFAAILNAKYGLITNEAAIRRFLDKHATAVGDDVVLAIEAYLNEQVRPQWEKYGRPTHEPRAPISSFPGVARAFFRMGKHKIKQYHRSVPGTYRFYAYSELERGRNAVCVGAIRFKHDFNVDELQTSVELNGETIREEYQGHYLYRDDSLIAMLRHKQGHEPKFYILSIPSYDTVNGQRQSLTGLLLKVGEKRDVFGTTIHMVRHDNAFEETVMIDREKMDETILEMLDDRQWLPR